MNLNSYTDLTQAIREFQKRGFNRTFKFNNNNLQCYQTGKTYLSDELEIVEYDRFVGNFLNPESSIIFAISCHDGEQGYIISSESNMASHQLLKFMDKVKIQRRKNHIPPTKFDDSSYNSKNY